MRTMMTMIAILILAVACAGGHDIYSGLKDHLGEASCCDERDCRPAHYRITPAGVEMLLDDEWVRVPDSVVQYRSRRRTLVRRHELETAGSVSGARVSATSASSGIASIPVFYALRDPAAGTLLKVRFKARSLTLRRRSE
jgi:hypothetical protein